MSFKPEYLYAVAFSVLFLPSAKGLSVEERNGNIYLVDNAGFTQMTKDGSNRSPALSVDKSEFVFIHDLGPAALRRAADDSLGPEFGPSQLWICSTKGGSAPRLILDSPTILRGRRFFGFYSPQIAADNKSVYFQVAFAATSLAVARLTLASGDVVFVTDALTFSVIPTGRYRSDLIIQQHRPKVGGGYYDWYYITTPNGQEVGVIGADKSDVYDFIETYVGDVGACQNWNGSDWMSCISQIVS